MRTLGLPAHPSSCDWSPEGLCLGDCEADTAYCGKFTRAVAACVVSEDEEEELHCGCTFGFYLTGWFEIPEWEILDTSLVRVCIDNLDGTEEFHESNNCLVVEVVSPEPTATRGTSWTTLKTIYR